MRRLAWTLLLAAFLGLVAWLALGTGDDRALDGGADVAVSGSARRATTPPAAPSRADAGQEVDTAGGSSALPGREAVRTAPPEGTRTVSGRVDIGMAFPPDLEVRVLAISNGESRTMALARSESPVGEDGAFSFEVPAAARTVLLQALSPVLRESDGVTAAPGDRDVVLRVEPLACLVVRVTRPGLELDAPDLVHDPRVLVRCFAEGEREPVASDWFDSDAEFVLPGVRPGVPLTVEVTSEIRDMRSEVRSPGMSARLALAPLQVLERRRIAPVLAPDVRLSGSVRDARGAPVIGARVRVLPRTEWRRPVPPPRFTDADGRFLLDPLAPGTWMLEASAPGRDRARVEVDLPGAAERDVVFALGPAPVVRGRVLDAEGEPVRGATVGVIDEEAIPAADDARWLAHTFTRASTLVDGRRTTTGAAGEFELQAHSDAVRLVALRENAERSAVESLTLYPGEERTDVELVLQPPGRLTGRVESPAGEPLSLSLRFIGASGELATFHAAGGRFDTTLPAGRGRLTAATGSDLSGEVAVELRPGATSEVRLVVDGGILPTLEVLERARRTANESVGEQ